MTCLMFISFVNYETGPGELLCPITDIDLYLVTALTYSVVCAFQSKFVLLLLFFFVLVLCY